jgi:ribonuclease BN (tRNA processing enzyme)
VNELRLSFVGTGNAFAPGGLCWNGFVLNERFLFEAPPQALQSLNRMGMDPNELDAVILSHHHGDHFLGLPFLLLHWKYFGRTRPVVIVGPPGTEELAMSIAESVYPGIREMKFEVDWREVNAGDATRLGELELQALPVKHDERLSATLGFTASFRQRNLAYTGDSAMCDAVLEMARHAEVLVTECASVSDRVPVHMNLVDDMPVLRAAMKPEAELVLTHLDVGMSADGLPRARIAEDLATYRF